jgi:hypothetical protein
MFWSGSHRPRDDSERHAWPAMDIDPQKYAIDGEVA